MHSRSFFNPAPEATFTRDQLDIAHHEANNITVKSYMSSKGHAALALLASLGNIPTYIVKAPCDFVVRFTVFKKEDMIAACKLFGLDLLHAVRSLATVVGLVIAIVISIFIPRALSFIKPTKITSPVDLDFATLNARIEELKKARNEANKRLEDAEKTLINEVKQKSSLEQNKTALEARVSAFIEAAKPDAISNDEKIVELTQGHQVVLKDKNELIAALRIELAEKDAQIRKLNEENWEVVPVVPA